MGFSLTGTPGMGVAAPAFVSWPRFEAFEASHYMEFPLGMYILSVSKSYQGKEVPDPVGVGWELTLFLEGDLKTPELSVQPFVWDGCSIYDGTCGWQTREQLGT